MLKKNYRMHVGEQYSFIDSFYTPYFLVKIAKNNLLHSRYGFVISKKIDKRAVVRNSMRRKLSACLQQNIEKIQPGLDMLVVVKPAIKMSKQDVFCSALLDALEKKGYAK